MIKSLLAAFLLASYSLSAYSQTEWIFVANTSDDSVRWEAKPGSFEFSETKDGTPIAIIVGKITNKKTSIVALYKWYVSAEDCGRKMGKVVSLNVSGEFVLESDFVFDSGNISSGLAEFICTVADYAVSDKKKKSN